MLFSTDRLNLYVNRFLQHRETWLALVVILFQCVAVLGPALFFLPTNSDDLAMLSNVVNVAQPLKFFYSDWGLGNGVFRPLHPLSIWVAHRLFGVFALPNQAFNLLLHVVNTIGLYKLLQKWKPGTLWAVAITSLFAISRYTSSPATWVSDRPSLFVGFALLCVIHHLIDVWNYGVSFSVVKVLIFSAIALLGKESGMVVILICFWATFQLGLPRRKLRFALSLFGILLVIYVALRGYALRNVEIVYPGARGYLMGQFYADWSKLEPTLRIQASVENIVKNLATPLIPIFGEFGQIDFLGNLWLLVPMFALLAISIYGLKSRKADRLCVLGILVIALNAFVHFAIFRYRVHYLSQLGFCMVVFASLRFFENKNAQHIALVFIIALVLFEALTISRTLSWLALIRYDDLMLLYRNPDAWSGIRVDPNLVNQIISRYAMWLSQKTT